MKKPLPDMGYFILFALATVVVAVIMPHSRANSDYNAGASFAKDVAGQGTSGMKSFDPASAVEGYTSRPAEVDYYPGGTATSTSINEKGVEHLVSSEVGQAVTDSMVNNPTDTLSLDAPFLENGLNAQQNAEAVVSGTGDVCEKQTVSHIRFDRYVCNKDVNVEEACSRTSSIGGTWKDTTTHQVVTIPPSAIRYSQSGATISFSFTAPVSGTINSGTMTVNPSGKLMWTSSTQILNSTFSGTWLNSATVTLNAAGITLAQGQTVTGTMTYTNSGLAGTALGWLNGGSATISLSLYVTVPQTVWEPSVSWSESCPFTKSEGVLVRTECTEAGGTKTVYVNGVGYNVYQSCWAYKDTYITQSAGPGTCGEYISNPACTVASRQCDVYSDDTGVCVNEAVTYECETVSKAEGMLCGGEFFCTDGSCAEVVAGQENGFKKAVSQLAAVAAAGDDVAALNTMDVRAFTGQGQACRKAMAGFSNCCKDSGWGNDIGIDNCNSEEKAIGEAKARKLTVEVGEYCSTKVLGVCLQKKRSYCVFDSKLAQIVQQQGRKWQLGIGFGSAKSPDCRGITIEELQRIQFDNLDFSNFYDDLQSGLTIPDEAALMERVEAQIKAELSKSTAEAK